ncbi:hypothetical protein QTP88_019909 [Uroleucon formosanum]
MKPGEREYLVLMTVTHFQIRLKLILWLKILRLKIRSFSSPSSVIPSPNLIKKSSKSLISKKREFMDIASETIKSLNAPMKEDDEYDIIGKRFVMQLRSMKDKQMFLAEKIIGDVMYYGRMAKLTENCFKFKNTNISTIEPRVNTTSMSQSQNNIIRPTFHSQKQTLPQEYIYNQQRQYMLENTYPFQLQSPHLQHDCWFSTRTKFKTLHLTIFVRRYANRPT